MPHINLLAGVCSLAVTAPRVWYLSLAFCSIVSNPVQKLSRRPPERVWVSVLSGPFLGGGYRGLDYRPLRLKSALFITYLQRNAKCGIPTRKSFQFGLRLRPLTRSSDPGPRCRRSPYIPIPKYAPLSFNTSLFPQTAGVVWYLNITLVWGECEPRIFFTPDPAPRCSGNFPQRLKFFKKNFIQLAYVFIYLPDYKIVFNCYDIGRI